MTKFEVEFYTRSTNKNCIRDVINAGTSEENIKIIDLGKNYVNPRFYPRKFQEWPDTFSVELIEKNKLSVRRTDINYGGWGSSLLIDVEDQIINSEIHLEEKKIPRVIYQTFKSKRLTRGMYESVDGWRQLNPQYEHYFYDDQDCIRFIKDNFDSTVLNAYLDLIPGAFKADLWRCCVLYLNGGVYVDSDMICLTNLDEYISNDDEFVVARDDPMSKSFIYNAFMACTPKHDFMKTQIESIVKNASEKKELFYLDISGPGLLGKSINKCLGRNPDSEFELGSVCSDRYKLKILSHEWKTRTINAEDRQLILTEYPEKNQEMEKEKIPTYYSLYQKGIVYQKIPRKIYFTCQDHLGINAYMVESFKEKNPNWELIFFSEVDRIRFFEENKNQLNDLLGVDVLEKYMQIKNGGSQADFWRYCVIFLNGGVYSDSDTMCIKPIEKWVLNHDLVLGIEACIPIKEDFYGLQTVGQIVKDKIISVCNWTFASTPKHDFFKGIILDICQKNIDEINNHAATFSTGPRVFTEHAFKYFEGCDFSDLDRQMDINKGSSVIFSVNKFGANQAHSNSCNYAECNDEANVVHFFDGSWRCLPNKKIRKYKSNLGVSHNLSLKKEGDKYLGISRLDKDTSRTIFLNKIGDCRSLVSLVFDNQFNLVSEKEVEIKNFNKKAKFEDYRIFSFRKKDYCSVSYIDEQFNTRVALLDNDFNFLGDIKLKDYVLNKAWDRIWEKNWLFFEKNNDLYLIYSTTPKQVIFKCVDFDNLTFEIAIDRDWPLNYPKENLYFSSVTTGGSTNPVYLDDKGLYFYLIHTKSYEKRKYNHYLIVLNKDLEPVKFCERPLINEFIPDPLCFVSSMIINEDYVVLSGGVDDNQNFIWELSKEFIYKKILGVF